jgi:hypothetical protein
MTTTYLASLQMLNGRLYDPETLATCERQGRSAYPVPETVYVAWLACIRTPSTGA